MAAEASRRMPCQFAFPRSWCPWGPGSSVIKSRFLDNILKIGHQAYNGLQTPKLSKKPLCYRTIGKSTVVVTWVRREGLLHGECAPGVRDVCWCSWGRGDVSTLFRTQNLTG